MATFYWVGGAGIWDTASISNWSDSSGGLPGAGVPGASDTVVFDAASDAGGAFTVTLGANITVQGVSITGLDQAMTLAFGTWGITVNGNNAAIWNVPDASNFAFTGSGLVVSSYTGATGTREITHGTTGGTEAKAINLTVNGGTDFVRTAGHFGTFNCSGFKGQMRNSARTIYKNFTLDILMTFEAGDLVTTFAGSAAQTLSPAGVNMACPVVLDSAATKTLTGALVLGNKNLSLVRGTFDSAGYIVACARLLSSNGNVRNLALGASEWDLGGDEVVWDVSNPTNLTLSAQQSTINLDPMRANLVFAGGGQQYGKLSLAAQRMLAEVVVAAGGGGGAGSGTGSVGTGLGGGGGGGAGGYLDGSIFLPLQKPLSVIVGGGGGGSINSNGGNGSNSIIHNVILVGGGGGGFSIVGNDGGSGGGSRISQYSLGTPNQGNNGGFGNGGSIGGGGGGAGSVGVSSPNRPDGGVGRVSSITGQSVGRAGGGGGFRYGSTERSVAVDGGGSGGATTGSNSVGLAATANTGGGGGGGYSNNSSLGSGGAGGSGVIILRIPASYTATFSAGVTRTENTTTAPGYKIITITATSTVNETVTFS